MSKDEKSFFERMQEWREWKEKKEGRVKEIEESGEEVVWVMGVPHRKTDPEFREWVSEHKDPEVEHSLEEGPNGNVDIISEDVLNSFTPSGDWNGYVFSWDGKSLQWKRR